MRRRTTGEPLAYITGHKEFYGLDLTVDSRVLVPRPDTETLVDWALEVLTSTPGTEGSDLAVPLKTRVIDLGTGRTAPMAVAFFDTARRPRYNCCLHAVHLHVVHGLS